MCPAPKQEIKSQEKPRYALKKRLTEERPRKGTPSGAFSPAFLNHTVERSSPAAGKESDSRGGRWEVQLRAGGDDGPPDNVPAFAVPVIGTNAPDVVEHNGLALVLPYI